MTKTCSLMLSKKLWELGLRIETEKWWNNLNGWQVVSKACNNNIIWRNEYDRGIKIENYPAPSTDELLEVLPEFSSITKMDKEYQVYHPEKNDYDKNPAEALGRLTLYLLEHGYKFNPKTGGMEK